MARICSAHRSNGDPCRAQAIRGGTVCFTHGGAARQVKQSARDRLLAMVEPALFALRKLIDSADSDAVKLAAVKAVLDYCGYKVPDKLEQSGELVIQVEYVSPPLPKPAQNGYVKNGVTRS